MRIVYVKDAARQLDVPKQTLELWLKNGCPGKDPVTNEYDIGSIAKWAAEKGAKPPPRSLPELAAILGVNEKSLRRWRSDGMPLGKTDGFFDVDAAVGWYLKNKSNVRDFPVRPCEDEKDSLWNDPKDDPWEQEKLSDHELRVLDARKSELEHIKLALEVKNLRAQAGLESHKTRVLVDNVVSQESLQLWLVRFFTETRRKLLRIPEQLPPGFPEEFRSDIRQRLEKKCEEMLQRVHNWVIEHSVVIEQS